MPVIAGNAPASLVRCVGRQGLGYLSSLPAGKRGWAAATIHTEDGPYKKKFLEFLGADAAHGGAGAAENSFAAQATRDDTMAESIANYLRANSGHLVMHVTGVFHVEDRLGTIERLKMRAPDLKIALVLPIETDDTATSGTADKGADFAILLKPEPAAYVNDDERKTAEAREVSSMRAMTRDGCNG
jgi:uncharacterized iron-regulated protein